MKIYFPVRMIHQDLILR